MRSYYEPIGKEIDVFTAAFKNKLPLLLKGPTGCGKSRFLANLYLSLLDNGMAATLIDPHGDLAEGHRGPCPTPGGRGARRLNRRACFDTRLRALLSMTQNLMRPEEHKDALEAFYEECRNGILSYEVQRERMLHRLKPLNN